MVKGAEALEAIFATMPGAVIVVGEHGAIEMANAVALQLLGYTEAELLGLAVTRVVAGVNPRTPQRIEASWCARDGERIPVLHSAAALGGCTVCIAMDLRGRKQLEHELRQAHKLESVGRLAAGVAHEINTPLQYISDSIYFLRDAMQDLATAVEQPGDGDVDVPYLLANMPKAFQRSLDGLARVTAIVRSMKELSDTSSEMTLVDLNAAIGTTLMLAVSEYKHVAEVVTDFAELPLVTCVGSDVQQAILNIVINAAHAIGDVVKGSDDRGRITVTTRVDGAHAVIAIRDTGCGIPENIRGNIFDPFFTTKDVGRGTGQGLSLAWAVIVDRHAGELTVDSEVGTGSTFTIRLPVATGSFASTWSLFDAPSV